MGSLLTALLIFAAIPAVLVTVVGYPLGDGLGHQWGGGARVAFAGLTLVAWVAWLACCAQLTRSVVAQVRRGHVTPSVGAVLTERVAARIAAGVLSLIAVAAPLFVASEAGASSTGVTGPTIGIGAPRTSRTLATPATEVLPPVASTATAEGGRPASSLQSARSTVYMVRPGDSLWSIAETQLGDGGDWPALAALNLGRTMSDGLRFVDPGLIQVGWTLDLPKEGGDTWSSARHRRPAVAGPTATSTPTPTSTSAADPSSPSVGTAQARPFGHDIVATGLTLPAETVMVAPPSGSLTAEGVAGSTLPELSALGIGALACAALARRSRRMRLLRRIDNDESEPGSDHTTAAVDTDIRLARFSGVPSLHAFESANYALGLVMDALRHDHPSTVTTIRAVCVGRGGSRFLAGRYRATGSGRVQSLRRRNVLACRAQHAHAACGSPTVPPDRPSDRRGSGRHMDGPACRAEAASRWWAKEATICGVPPDMPRRRGPGRTWS